MSRRRTAGRALRIVEAAYAAGDLDGALDALGSTPPHGRAEAARWAALAADLGLALRLRFEDTGVAADLDTAIVLGGSAVEHTAAADPGLAFHLSTLANSVHLRYEDRGDPADLDAAIQHARAAVDAGGPGDPSHAMYLSNLGNALRARAEHTGSLEDLEDAVRHGRAALAATPPADADRAMFEGNLSLAFRVRFERTQSKKDLNEAVDAVTRALACAAADDPGRPAWLSSLGGCLRIRYEWYGDPVDLESSIDAGHRAVEEADPTDADLGLHLSNLGLALLARFGVTSQASDIDGAALAVRRAIDSVADDSPDLPTLLSNLGLILRIRFGWRGERADLEAALEAGSEAIARTPEGHQDRALYQSNQATARCERYIATGSLADLAEAIDMVRAAAAAMTDRDASFSACMANLGMTLRERYLRLGDEADLDEAIDAERAALAGVPEEHFQRPDFLTNLALTVRLRYEYMGIRGDLEEAVRLSRAAHALTGPDNPEYPAFLSHLGTALHASYEETQDEADLEEAIQVSERAVAACSATHPDRAMHLHNLGLALEDRSERRENDHDLAEAVEVGRAALRAVADDDPLLPISAAALASRLLRCFDRTGDRTQVQEAVTLGRRAVESTPDGHPDQAGHLLSLGESLHAQATQVASAPEAAEALDCVRKATGLTTARVKDRIRAAHRWGLWAWEHRDLPDAAAGFTAAVTLLPTLAWVGFDRETQEESLAQWNGLLSQAISCLAQAGQQRRAVELAEQGRSVLWGHLLRLRGAVHELGSAHPDLAAQLHALRAQLDRPAEWSRTGRRLPDRPDTQAEQSLVERRRAARQWDALIAQVRELDGFHDFQQAAPFHALAEAAAHGPVILVNTSGLGSHAIVVSAGEAAVVPLPLADPDRAEHLISSWPPDPAGPAVPADLLAWSWQAIVAPVLNAIDLPAERPRVWWSPVGPASFLPLHAAGDAHDNVWSHVLSSYTPTLGALVEARARPRPASVRQLIVGAPEADGHAVLPATARETAAVAARFPAERVCVLTGARANARAVRHELDRSHWILFACHARHDRRHPADSAFLLSDSLTVGELAQVHLGSADLAVLSACETAAGTVRLHDESVNLAAALRIVGFRHVIATLWPVADASAYRLVTRLYAGLVPDGVPDSDRAASALEAAVGVLRRRYPHRPEQWAAFIHMGP